MLDNCLQKKNSFEDYIQVGTHDDYASLPDDCIPVNLHRSRFSLDPSFTKFLWPLIPGCTIFDIEGSHHCSCGLYRPINIRFCRSKEARDDHPVLDLSCIGQDWA